MNLDWEGVIDPESVRTEDDGMARSVELDPGEGRLFVRLHSWSQDKAHPELASLVGKRVRIRVEVVDEGPSDAQEEFQAVVTRTEAEVFEGDQRVADALWESAAERRDMGPYQAEAHARAAFEAGPRGWSNLETFLNQRLELSEYEERVARLIPTRLDDAEYQVVLGWLLRAWDAGRAEGKGETP